MNAKLKFSGFAILVVLLLSSLNAFSQSDSLIKIGPSLYAITGLGGNITVKETSQGVILVDAGTSYEAGNRLEQIVKGITSKPITHIILTHYHYDHTRGLAAFPKGITIIAHKNVSGSLKKDEASIKKDIEENIPAKIKAYKTELAAIKGNVKHKAELDSSIKAETANLEMQRKIKIVYPTKVYDQDTSLIIGSDTILLYHPENTHTNGDTWVYFKNDNAVALGDMLFTHSFPYIDTDADANTLNWAKQLNSLAGQNYAFYIPGHANMAKSDDLRQFAAYLTDLRNAINTEINKGKSLDEIKKSVDLVAYRDFGFQFFKEQNIEAVYKELSKK